VQAPPGHREIVAVVEAPGQTRFPELLPHGLLLQVAAIPSLPCTPCAVPDWISDSRPVLVVAGAGRALSKLAYCRGSDKRSPGRFVVWPLSGSLERLICGRGERQASSSVKCRASRYAKSPGQDRARLDRRFSYEFRGSRSGGLKIVSSDRVNDHRIICRHGRRSLCISENRPVPLIPILLCYPPRDCRVRSEGKLWQLGHHIF
jgi:hypothetical protein